MGDASAVPSEIASIIALLILSAIVLLLLRFYLPLRSTPAYVLITVFFAVWLPAVIVLLVPIDLASSVRTDDEETRGVWLPSRTIEVSWRISYWLTFALTWFILPILAEYSDAGYRDPKGKILYSLRSNAQYYITVFGCGIIGLVYVFVYYGIHSDSLKSPVMALAYCWGLILAIYLMGHGLVAIPRGLYRNASITGRLRRLQTRAPKTLEKLEDADMKLEDYEMLVTELGRRKTGSAALYADWVEELADMTSLLESQPSSSTGPRGTGDAQHLPTVITEKYMADLTRNLLRAKQIRGQYAKEWTDLVNEARDVQEIIDSGPSQKLTFSTTSAPHYPMWERINILTPYTRYLLHFHILPTLHYIACFLLALASFCIIWSEIIKIGKESWAELSIIRLTVVRLKLATSQVSFSGQLFSAFWICYMCAAALTSITQVRVWRGRALVKGNTAHESAFWYASHVARLSVPLSYNFITFLHRSVYEKTQFYHFLGRLIDLTPLGEWFDRLFPLFILLPVCATLFGLYGKVKRYVGWSDSIVGDYLGGDDGEDDDNDDFGFGVGGEAGGRSSYGTGSWREGRDLLEREINGTSIRANAAAAGGGGTATSRAMPIRSVPGGGSRNNAAADGGAITPFSTSPNLASPGFSATPGAARAAAAGGRRNGRYRDNATTSTDGEEDGFFASFGHRVKNTIDTIDTPRWFQDISGKKPRWMGNTAGVNGGGGNDNDTSNMAGRPPGWSSSSTAEGSRPRPQMPSKTGSDVRRWFGGSGVNIGGIKL